MILPFSTMLNGKPTYFVERIQKALSTEEPPAPLFNYRPTEFNTLAFLKVAPKLHTIRIDEKRRWRAGKDIHFFINNRKPNMFMFAPVTKVVSTQSIFMTYFHELEISIDSRQLCHAEIDELFKNDGFNNFDDFESYFLSQMNEDKEFSGKIIHWTDKRY